MSLPTLGAGPSAIAGTSAWTPSSPDADGNTPHTGFAPWLLTGIYQDSAETTTAASDGDPVGAMNNTEMFGSDAYSVTQGTTANKPTLRTGANGLDSQPVLEFDGGDELRGAFNGGALSQPVTIIAVAQLDGSVLNDNNNYFICDGDDASNRLALYKWGSTNPDAMTIYGGSNVSGDAPDANWHIYMVHFNTASSEFWRGGTSEASGNAGSNTMDGATLGSSQSGGGWVGKIAALFIIDGLASDAVLNQYGAYLQSIFPSLSYTEIT